MVGRPGFPLDAAMLLGWACSSSGRGALDAPGRRSPAATSAVGFEAEPLATGRDLLALRARPGLPGMEVHLELVDGEGGRAHPMLTTPWGGLALDPFVVEPGLEGRTRWILEPFVFLARALDLPPLPMLDATTENGRRIFTSHIDGDGFVSVSEMPHRKLCRARSSWTTSSAATRFPPRCR